MDKFKKIIAFCKFLTLFLLITMLILSFTLTHKNNVKAENIESEIVMESYSKRILYEHNSHIKKYMASTTKILTAITIIENCNLNDIVTITKETCGVEGSSIYLEEGEKLSVKDLLYGLMLRSGNDCAETLACYCSGTIDNFAKLMNDTARKIGATESNFVNPHGLHDDNHYSTAYDLALISAYSMKNKDFAEIVSTKQIRIPFTTRNTMRLLKNKNKMLNEFDGATGIKTGYTKKAGRCLVTSAKRNGMELICVVLNCPPMFERSTELLNETYNNYSDIKLMESDNIIDFIKCNGKNYAITIKNDIILPLTEYEQKHIKIKYEYPKNINNLKNFHKEIGNVKIYLKNNLLFTEKIYIII